MRMEGRGSALLLMVSLFIDRSVQTIGSLIL